MKIPSSPWFPLTVVGILMFCMSGVPAHGAVAMPPLPRYAAGELLVKPVDPSVLDGFAANARVGAAVLDRYPFIGWMRVRLPDGMSVEDGMALYRAMPDVAAVEPNYVAVGAATPNDTSYSQLWGMSLIGAPAAWDVTTGSAGVVVAVVDSGVNYNHQDLAANMWHNPGEIPGNGKDDDGNGYVDDVYGIDAANSDSDPVDDSGHGSHCSGTIGAVGNNGKGVAGVNWAVRIMALKFLKPQSDGSTFGYYADAIKCYQYATYARQHGVNLKVLSNSWGGTGNSSALEDAFTAMSSAGLLNVIAAMNGGSDGVGDNNDVTKIYPADFTDDSIIAVAASTETDAAASFSNYGPTSVDLAAPGTYVYSTVLGTAGYAYYNGTSMATPHVAGAAALLWAHSPDLTAAQVKALLLNNVDPEPAWTNKTVTGGRLNVAKAMAVLNTAASLTFDTQPGIARTGRPLSVQPIIRALDSVGVLASSYTGTVTLSIKSGTGTAGATLLGITSMNAVKGIATFDNVAVSKAGNGYVLTAKSGAFSVDSQPFNVLPGYTLADVIRTARIAGGLLGAATADIDTLNVVEDDGAAKLDLQDAVAIMRKVKGLGTNP